MEPDQNHSRKAGNTVETKNYIFVQAANSRSIKSTLEAMTTLA